MPTGLLLPLPIGLVTAATAGPAHPAWEEPCGLDPAWDEFDTPALCQLEPVLADVIHFVEVHM